MGGGVIDLDSYSGSTLILDGPRATINLDTGDGFFKGGSGWTIMTSGILFQTTAVHTNSQPLFDISGFSLFKSYGTRWLESGDVGVRLSAQGLSSGGKVEIYHSIFDRNEAHGLEMQHVRDFYLLKPIAQRNRNGYGIYVVSNQTYGVIRGAHLEDHDGYDQQSPSDWGINCSLADTIGVYDCISSGCRIWVDDSSCRVENCGVQTLEPATYNGFKIDNGTQPGDDSMICGNFTRGGKPNWDAAKLPDGTAGCKEDTPCSPGNPPCQAPDTSTFTCPPHTGRAEALVADEAGLRKALFDTGHTWIRLEADIDLTTSLDLTPLHQCSGMNFLRFDSDTPGTRRRLKRTYTTGEPMLAWKHDQFGGEYTLHFSAEEVWFDGNETPGRLVEFWQTDQLFLRNCKFSDTQNKSSGGLVLGCPGLSPTLCNAVPEKPENYCVGVFQNSMMTILDCDFDGCDWGAEFINVIDLTIEGGTAGQSDPNASGAFRLQGPSLHDGCVQALKRFRGVGSVREVFTGERVELTYCYGVWLQFPGTIRRGPVCCHVHHDG